MIIITKTFIIIILKIKIKGPSAVQMFSKPVKTSFDLAERRAAESKQTR